MICEVKSREEAECIDRKPTGERSLPAPDDEDSDLGFESVEIDGDWTTVTFLKPTAPLDGQDYDLSSVGAGRCGLDRCCVVHHTCRWGQRK